MSNSSSLPKTEHLEVDKAAYRRLTRQAISEIIRCLLATEAPSDLTMEKVRERVRVFAACSTEPWARATDAIQYNSRAQHASSNTLQAEYFRLIRALRDQLINTLLIEEREVWEETRKRMITQARYGIFRITKSTVHLHRLTPNRQHQHYG